MQTSNYSFSNCFFSLLPELQSMFLAIIGSIREIALKICKPHFAGTPLEKEELSLPSIVIIRNWEVKCVPNHSSSVPIIGGTGR